MAESKRVAFWISKLFNRRDISSKIYMPFLLNTPPQIHRRSYSASDPEITTAGASFRGGGGEATDGAMRGTESAESVGEMAKKTMDTAFDVARGTTQAIKETVVAGAEENVIDTSEYRSIEDMSQVKTDDEHKASSHI